MFVIVGIALCGVKLYKVKHGEKTFSRKIFSGNQPILQSLFKMDVQPWYESSKIRLATQDDIFEQLCNACQDGDSEKVERQVLYAFLYKY